MIVYKYYSPEQYNFDALKNHYFWFSKVSKLNDPFDSSSKLLRPSCFRENLLKECNIDEDKLSSIMLQYAVFRRTTTTKSCGQIMQTTIEALLLLLMIVILMSLTISIRYGCLIKRWSMWIQFLTMMILIELSI